MQSRRSELDPRRSSSGLLGLIGLAALGAIAASSVGCSDDFDTSRVLPQRGSVGEEMYGVICDRVGAQALREDLTGASFHAVCHRVPGGQFADKVDVAKLPELDPNGVGPDGKVVAIDQQQADRAYAIGRIETLGSRRDDLIRALDATFPADQVAVMDLDNGNDKLTCNAPAKSGQGLLTDQIARMLGRMGDLYDDGTIPQSTESLARVVGAFQNDQDAQAAWARLSARQGYRPVSTALGAIRPIVSYPHLRDLSNASLRLLSADSNPYILDPQLDSNGNRVPIPGPGNAALNKLLEASHEELLAVTADPDAGPLTSTTEAGTGRVVLSRPRDNVEIFQQILFASDPTYGGAGASSKYIVRRDPRGYAAINGGQVPAPFVDKDGDHLPDVDDSGRFLTSDGSVAPSPFDYPGAPQATRDKDGRALVSGGQLLYDYVDTSHTFAAQMLSDLKPLVNPDPTANHETLMDLLAGLYVAVGPRVQSSKDYADKSVDFNGVSTKDSPMLDLVYAATTILSDRNADTTLAVAHDLFANQTPDIARTTGALLGAWDIAQKHPEAHIPANDTFWDENLDTMAQIVQEPGLLEDLLVALGDPNTANLGTVFSSYAKFKDQITYDKNNLNGPAFNATLNSATEMKTPVDRGQPETGDNRSGLYRFLQLINDTTGVTACNKDQAVVHAKLAGLSVTMPLLGTYQECEVFKIDNLAAFYLDSITNAQQYDGAKTVKRGAFYLRNDTLRNGIALGIGAATVSLMQDSSGIDGWWTDGSSKTLAPMPQFLNRQVFFDLKNDNVNTTTKSFIQDLQGDYMGTSVCPERVITDPVPGAPDASSDGMVHGLRNCPDGEWLQQRGKNTIFTWEDFGFYDAIRPLLSAFVKHGREDLFLKLSNATYKHWAGAEASADECRLLNDGTCPRAGMNTYEPLITEAFATDVLPAVSNIAAVLGKMTVNRCDAVDATTHACTKTTAISGIDAIAAATRMALDPDYSKNTLQLKDRNGNVTSKRNDGTTNPQVTPAYLITQALSGIDATFDAYATAHPNDTGRHDQWRRARSQLVDQFLGVQGAKSTATFKNPAIAKITPQILDVLRGQLNARCPQSFAAPYTSCDWAKKDLVQHATDTLGGPLFGSSLDVFEAVRADTGGRVQMETLLQYLLDAASDNDALASLLASANDIIQVMHDDRNLVPLYHLLASAADASVVDANGHVTQKSLLDAQMALLARINGRYFDQDDTEICSKEVDPQQVLPIALGHLVTPITDTDFNGQTPLEVIMDVIADVNRQDPTQPYDGTLAQTDYASVSKNVVDFLTNKENGLEQFYQVIRTGTGH